METIKTILEDIFKRRKIDSALNVYRILNLWENAVGPRIARHSQPKRLRDHILWVVVDNSTWMQELTFLEGKIKKELNQRIGSPLIEKIRFHLGEIQVSGTEVIRGVSSPGWEEIEIDDTVRKNIEKEVTIIKDDGLKARLRSLFQKHAQYEAYRERK